MPISDEELVRQLESVPLVDPGDFRESVMSRIGVEDRRSRLSGQAGLPVLHLYLASAALIISIATLLFVLMR